MYPTLHLPYRDCPHSGSSSKRTGRVRKQWLKEIKHNPPYLDHNSTYQKMRCFWATAWENRVKSKEFRLISNVWSKEKGGLFLVLFLCVRRHFPELSLHWCPPPSSGWLQGRLWNTGEGKMVKFSTSSVLLWITVSFPILLLLHDFKSSQIASPCILSSFYSFISVGDTE